MGQHLADLPTLFASLPHLSAAEAVQLADDLTAAQEVLARAMVTANVREFTRVPGLRVEVWDRVG